MLDDHLDDLFGSGRAFIKDKEPTVTIKGNMDNKTKVRIKEPHDRIDDVNDQNNIREINTRNELASLRAWIEQVSKSEALHAERVIANTLDVTKLKGEVLQLQECEDLRDDQMKVLQTVINKLIAYIERDGYEWKVLDVPKAKK